MGPTPTVPPDRPATPRSRRHHAADPLGLDRPPAAPPDPTTSTEAPPLATADLDNTRERSDLAADLLATEPLLYRPEVVDSHLQPPEPLGRRTPEPLDAAREGIER